MEVFLTYLICLGWVKSYITSILAFNITQFFPSTQLLTFTGNPRKAGFDSRISSFFFIYLIGRKTQYL